MLSQIMIYHNILSGLMQKLTQSLYIVKAKGALKFAILDPPLKDNYSWNKLLFPPQREENSDGW